MKSPPHRSTRRARARRALVTLALTLGALAPVGHTTASDRVRPERLTVYADVIDVRPVYREVRVRESAPRRECWIEERRHTVTERPVSAYRGHRDDRRHGSGDTLVGGVIGGVIGNQLGRDAGRGGRAGATIAGAIIGSAIANEASAGSARHRRHQAPRTYHETRPIERCRTVESSRSEQRLQHYDVTYRYDGRRYVTRLKRDPGPTLELEVTVRPARH